MTVIICLSCGYEGEPESFDVSLSVYSDIRCPKCKSTNNKHNSDYKDSLLKNMSESDNRSSEPQS